MAGAFRAAAMSKLSTAGTKMSAASAKVSTMMTSIRTSITNSFQSMTNGWGGSKVPGAQNDAQHKAQLTEKEARVKADQKADAVERDLQSAAKDGHISEEAVAQVQQK